MQNNFGATYISTVPQQLHLKFLEGAGLLLLMEFWFYFCVILSKQTVDLYPMSPLQDPFHRMLSKGEERFLLSSALPCFHHLAYVFLCRPLLFSTNWVQFLTLIHFSPSLIVHSSVFSLTLFKVLSKLFFVLSHCCSVNDSSWSDLLYKTFAACCLP